MQRHLALITSSSIIEAVMQAVRFDNFYYLKYANTKFSTGDDISSREYTIFNTMITTKNLASSALSNEYAI